MTSTCLTTKTSELSSLVQDLMNDIDIKPLHPKHKLLLHRHYVLSKLSWHFTIANISKTWITEHLDSVVNGYIRKWLDIPISGTLGKIEEQLPQSTVDQPNSWPTVVYRLLRKSSADCWQHVDNSLAKFWLRAPVEYQKSLSSQGRTLHIDTK